MQIQENKFFYKAFAKSFLEDNLNGSRPRICIIFKIEFLSKQQTNYDFKMYVRDIQVPAKSGILFLNDHSGQQCKVRHYIGTAHKACTETQSPHGSACLTENAYHQYDKT